MSKGTCDEYQSTTITTDANGNCDHRRGTKKLDERVRDKHQRLRNRYPEIYGKVVDWIHHYIEDGTLYVCIRFQDKTDFALEFSPQIVRVGTELCDSATDDFDVIRNYYREERE